MKTQDGDTRRQFLTRSLATGFAASVAPTGALLAQVVHTEAAGLTASAVGIPTADREIPAYRAVPADAKRPPVVLVVQEVFGVHEHIRDVCRRLARLGCMAIAPELYARQGDASTYTEVQKLIADIVSKVPDAQVMADLDATVAWAAKQGADTTRLGITGFCWGGRIVWLYGAHQPALKAGVAWYGRLTGEKNALQTSYPYDLAGALKAPVLGLYGGVDQGIPVDTVDEMKRRLAAGTPAARQSQFVVYPDAPHAFFADYRPSYRKDAAEDGWKRATDWFRQHGVL